MSIMKKFILFILVTYLLDVHCATTRRPDVEPSIDPTFLTNSNNEDQPSKTSIVSESLSSPADIRNFGPLLDGAVVEPVLINDGNLIGQISNNNVQVPILIKDDNLISKPTEPVPEPILIVDDNVTVSDSEEESSNDTTFTQSNMTDDKKDIVTPTIPTETSTVGNIVSVAQSEQAVENPGKPCPDFESRYEDGKFIVTLDEGKCEMVVGDEMISEDTDNPWATGRFTPIYQLLSRQYRPELKFRPTPLAPADYNCVHHTRQTGPFFVVDTVLGKCQMVIGIPTLPDLRYIMSHMNPTMPVRMRNMPTWPRPPSTSTESDSED